MKPLRNVALIATLSLIFCGPSMALELPKHSPKDHRVRYVEYDPSNVIQLDAVVGVATHIQLERDEQYLYHVFGDSEAYEFTHKLNHLFFKPIADQADTNLTVITDRREYTFRISYHNDRNSKALYKLVLRYPDSQAAQVAAIEQERAVERAWSTGQPSAFNWQTYMKSGALDLAPIHAWDDGRHTSMQFSPHAELPSIYYVDADGQESIANYHMADPNTIVLHRTAAKWYLRMGNRVAAIYNQGYGLLPKPVQTGTTSAKVVRVVEGEEPSVPIVAPLPFETAVAYDLTPQTSPVASEAVAPAPETQPVPTQPTAAPAPVAAPAPAPAPAPLAEKPVVAQSQAPGTELTPGQQKQSVAAKPTQSESTALAGFEATEGDRALLPQRITVAEGHTKFKFKTPDVPGVWPLDETGAQKLAGMHVEPHNTIVVHDDADVWRLSKGGASLLLERRK